MPFNPRDEHRRISALVYPDTVSIPLEAEDTHTGHGQAVARCSYHDSGNLETRPGQSRIMHRQCKAEECQQARTDIKAAQVK